MMDNLSRYDISRQTRKESIRVFKDTTQQNPLDIFVVGAGITGCGAALDAASRGLSVGLIEKQDIAFGTSSRSSRLAHGGLRYLKQREFSLVHEALVERGLLLDTIAPHLVQAVPFIFPLRKRREVSYVSAGVKLYDSLSRIGSYGTNLPKPKVLSKEILRGLVPDINFEHVVGGMQYYDAQIDDTRHCLACARTAQAYGAHIVTQAKIVDLIFDSNNPKRALGAIVEIDNERVPVYARVIAGAVGVWSDELFSMAKTYNTENVRKSKGIHILVPKKMFRSKAAIITQTEKSVLFILPWGNSWIIGTTDTDWDGDLDEPSVTNDDIDYLLSTANQWLAHPLTFDDIQGVYAGIRPLVYENTKNTSSVSREHAIFTPLENLLLIAGGKYTTYRIMARDLIDDAVKAAKLHPITDSITDRIQLVGARGYKDVKLHAEEFSSILEFSSRELSDFVKRHGDQVTRLVELIADDPKLAQRITPDSRFIKAEIANAVLHEGAFTLEDILVRRMRVAQESNVVDKDLYDVVDVVRMYLGSDAMEHSEAISQFWSSKRARLDMNVQHNELHGTEYK